MKKKEREKRSNKIQSKIRDYNTIQKNWQWNNKINLECLLAALTATLGGLAKPTG